MTTTQIHNEWIPKGKKQLATWLLTAFCLFYYCNFTYGQVSIGMLEPPEKASLLQLSTQLPDGNNITSDKGGLLLPRVRLEDRKTLQPFVKITDNDWINTSSNKIKEKHAGLTVYNIYVSPNSETKQDKIFTQGIYTWNGEEWEKLATKDNSSRGWFYMPAFNLPLEAIGNADSYDLYAEYERQFTRNSTNNPDFTSNPALTGSTVPAPDEGTLYKRGELDYAVVYYDKGIINVTGVDSGGVMSYEVLDNDPGPTSFVTIIFIPK
ncbi:hypothetical protein GGR21_002971 [Dysgonomonas hofstadii]|uniref:Uncharacterized protein n=1 Tax=Dysgonomonas hofstadii TaxID=637886 RepID=A0A840CLX5_9BACT|nr:hypothetical protein [Dysgonomonas hofstadii]MBB4037057.1 hypothetical protein [Dysgonomonas hofstadii]